MARQTLKSAISISFFLMLFASQGEAQSKAPSLVGGAHGGIVQFNPISPTVNEIKLNNGFTALISGQKSAGGMHLYLLGGLEYVRTTGALNYNYTSITSVTYTTNQVGFSFDSIRASLSMRFKILENSFFRPYIEGGGSVGYTQISYDNNLRTLVGGMGSDYKTSDSALDFAGFGQAGVEADLSMKFGLEIAARYTHQSTRPFETFRRQTLSYDTLTYLAGIFLRF